jgi:hypothetical protein
MGWPKGKSRKKVPPAAESKPVNAQAQAAKVKDGTKHWTQRAGNNWESEKASEFLSKVRDYKADNWRDRSHDNPFSLSEEALDYLRASDLDVQWITESVYGQRQDRRFTAFLANGWTPVEPDTIPGVSAVEIDGSRLCVRPKAISDKARKADKAAATAAWDTKRQYLTEGIPLPSGAGAHPNAIRSNKLNRSLERIDVPRD